MSESKPWDPPRAQFLEGIASAEGELEVIEGWVAVLHTPEPLAAHLAEGYLNARGIETMLYPMQEATGFEHLPYPGISDALLGGKPYTRFSPQMIRILVDPDDAAEAIELLTDVRDHPEKSEIPPEE